MKKLKSLYKKNKVLFILTTIAIVCILVIIIGLLTSFYRKTNTSKYGDRLDGIEEVEITDSFREDLVSFYEENERVNEASVTLSGKIVYIIIDVTKGTTKAQAQTVANSGLEEFSEEEIEYYDFQFIVTCDDDSESEIYPTMGYKNNTSAKVVWINRN